MPEHHGPDSASLPRGRQVDLHECLCQPVALGERSEQGVLCLVEAKRQHCEEIESYRCPRAISQPRWHSEDFLLGLFFQWLEKVDYRNLHTGGLWDG